MTCTDYRNDPWRNADARDDGSAVWLRQAMVDAMAPLTAPVPVEVDVRIARTSGGRGE
jgi:hypothetical protein